ncbi:UDP-glucose 4-epimerase GalE [Williamsia sp. CHRR-6]|uniref:UDP-glucose 4-epimerase GalE n=1 Tax=Williamsia sp. CHRR-6 TaxID=2835871 RepID=UPI001BD9D06A|nr:UDP-glucose 4-epimerase GalE [Williamsia sp. CHRR-6]MBT0567923.1 UDP-glucose 4-epimerase GalE [Williamsia sp. CHRR-6]
MKLVVTGGAGYVGSVCARVLIEAGHQVTVVDNLSVGNRDAVPAEAEFVEGDISAVADDLLAGTEFDGVLHFAAKSLVGESVHHPELYWQGNVVESLALLEAIRVHQVPRLVFSSTAATYGEPDSVPIVESSPTRPTNAYGATKLAIDHAITSYTVAHDLAAVSLRYFNVAGAYAGAGENRPVETHLIPLVLQAALGHRDKVSIFGTDYPTDDGTAIRDYIHIYDLAQAHLLALAAATPGRHAIYNLGSGTGFSVRQVIDTCREVTDIDIPVVETSRRAGDPAVLIASSDKAIAELGWQPDKTELAGIVTDAWDYIRALGDRAHSARS